MFERDTPRLTGGDGDLNLVEIGLKQKISRYVILTNIWKANESGFVASKIQIHENKKGFKTVEMK